MLITHWGGAILFYLQAVEPNCFNLAPQLPINLSCAGREAVGAADQLTRHPSSRQAAPRRPDAEPTSPPVLTRNWGPIALLMQAGTQRSPPAPCRADLAWLCCCDWTLTPFLYTQPRDRNIAMAWVAQQERVVALQGHIQGLQ